MNGYTALADDRLTMKDCHRFALHRDREGWLIFSWCAF